MHVSTSTSLLLFLAAFAHTLAAPTLQGRQSIQCATADKNGSPLTGSFPTGDFVTCTYAAGEECTYFPADGSFSSGSSDCPKGIAQDPSATTDAPSSAGAAATPPPVSTPIATPSPPISISAPISLPPVSTPTPVSVSTPAGVSTPASNSTPAGVSTPAVSTPAAQTQTQTQTEANPAASASQSGGSNAAAGRGVPDVLALVAGLVGMVVLL
ncbi:hypothetical protein C8R44DRAFT_145610 [Mycena epipterygia]|nr:hypothetical protein C8R44DRAFT_145610 [Mycena epipterygia]